MLLKTNKLTNPCSVLRWRNREDLKE